MLPLQVPLPRMLCLCEDAEVLGEPFYVMSFLQGRIHLDPALPDLQPGQVALRTAALRLPVRDVIVHAAQAFDNAVAIAAAFADHVSAEHVN